MSEQLSLFPSSPSDPADNQPRWYTLRTDGAARGNPGPAAAAFLLQDPAGNTIASGAEYLGTATNNVAEYQALLNGLAAAWQQGVRRLRICSDSQLLIRQLRGEYRVRSAALGPLFQEAQRRLAQFEQVVLEHVPRAENAEADLLANAVLDAHQDPV